MNSFSNCPLRSSRRTNKSTAGHSCKTNLKPCAEGIKCIPLTMLLEQIKYIRCIQLKPVDQEFREFHTYFYSFIVFLTIKCINAQKKLKDFSKKLIQTGSLFTTQVLAFFYISFSVLLVIFKRNKTLLIQLRP